MSSKDQTDADELATLVLGTAHGEVSKSVSVDTRDHSLHTSDVPSIVESNSETESATERSSRQLRINVSGLPQTAAQCSPFFATKPPLTDRPSVDITSFSPYPDSSTYTPLPPTPIDEKCALEESGIATDFSSKTAGISDVIRQRKERKSKARQMMSKAKKSGASKSADMPSAAHKSQSQSKAKLSKATTTEERVAELPDSIGSSSIGVQLGSKSKTISSVLESASTSTTPSMTRTMSLDDCSSILAATASRSAALCRSSSTLHSSTSDSESSSPTPSKMTKVPADTRLQPMSKSVSLITKPSLSKVASHKSELKLLAFSDSKSGKQNTTSTSTTIPKTTTAATTTKKKKSSKGKSRKRGVSAAGVEELASSRYLQTRLERQRKYGKGILTTAPPTPKGQVISEPPANGLMLPTAPTKMAVSAPSDTSARHRSLRNRVGRHPSQPGAEGTTEQVWEGRDSPSQRSAHASGRGVGRKTHPRKDTATSRFDQRQQYEFTRRKWNRECKNVLATAAEKLDSVCRTLVKVQAKFGVCPTELRNLSFTVAVVERVVYTYWKEVMRYERHYRNQQKREAALKRERDEARKRRQQQQCVATPSSILMSITEQSAQRAAAWATRASPAMLGVAVPSAWAAASGADTPTLFAPSPLTVSPAMAAWTPTGTREKVRGVSLRTATMAATRSTTTLGEDSRNWSIMSLESYAMDQQSRAEGRKAEDATSASATTSSLRSGSGSSKAETGATQKRGVTVVRRRKDYSDMREVADISTSLPSGMPVMESFASETTSSPPLAVFAARRNRMNVVVPSKFRQKSSSSGASLGLDSMAQTPTLPPVPKGVFNTSMLSLTAGTSPLLGPFRTSFAVPTLFENGSGDVTHGGLQLNPGGSGQLLFSGIPPFTPGANGSMTAAGSGAMGKSAAVGSSEGYSYTHRSRWRHPGGIVSLLEILTRRLRVTETILMEIGSIASRYDYVRKSKFVWGFSGVFALVILTSRLKKPVLFVLLQCGKLTEYVWNLLDTVILPRWMKPYRLIPSSLRRGLQQLLASLWDRTKTGAQSSFIERLSTWIVRFRLLVLPTAIYLMHRFKLALKLRAVMRLTTELNRVVLFFILVMNALTPYNRLDLPLRERVKPPGGRKKTSTDIYKKMLERVPPSATIECNFWYGENFRLTCLKRSVDVMYATWGWYTSIFGSQVETWPLALPMVVYYTVNHGRAANRSNEFLADPDLKVIGAFYDFLDSPFMRWVTLKVLPRFGFIPRLKTARSISIGVRGTEPFDWHLDFQHLKRSRTGSRPQTPSTMHDSLEGLKGPSPDRLHPTMDAVLSQRRYSFMFTSTVKLLLFSTRKLEVLKSDKDFIDDEERHHGHNLKKLGFYDSDEDINDDTVEAASRRRRRSSAARRRRRRRQRECLDGSDDSGLSVAGRIEIGPNGEIVQLLDASRLQLRRPTHNERGLIFFLHGGAFVGNFTSIDLRWLAQLASLTDAVIVEVDYSLAPSKWPKQIQEVTIGYQAICEGKLGFNAQRIVVLAESSGASLAVSMVLKLIQEGRRIPDALILSSPILNLRDEPTTSRLLFMMDPLVPMRLIQKCRKMYLRPQSDEENDFLVSPLVSAPDHYLSAFPPTSIIVGGLDPYIDDGVDFAHRLANVGKKDVRLKKYELAPHSFLNFGFLLPDVSNAISLIASWVSEAMNM